MNKLCFEKVSFGYDKAIINDFSTCVKEKDLIAILGENGTGKTTLLKTLLKFIKPIKGTITYNNKNIESINAKQWSCVFSTVLSGKNHQPEIKVKDLLSIDKRISSEEQRFWEQKIGITELLDKYVNKISQGQLQKVMIVRAFMQGTPFMIFDEPTAHLDYKNKRKVFEALRNIVNETEKTIIIISHEIEYSLNLADRVWLIQDGKIHEGKPKEIKSILNQSEK